MIVFKNNFEEANEDVDSNDLKPKKIQINDSIVTLNKKYAELHEIISNINEDKDQSEIIQISIPDLSQYRIKKPKKKGGYIASRFTHYDDSDDDPNEYGNYRFVSSKNVFKSNFDGFNSIDKKIIKDQKFDNYILNCIYDNYDDYTSDSSFTKMNYYDNKMMSKSNLPKPECLIDPSNTKVDKKLMAVDQFQLILEGHNIIIPDFMVDDMMKIAEKFEIHDLIDQLTQFKEEFKDLEHYNKFSEIEILMYFQDLLSKIDEENFKIKTSVIYSMYLYIGDEFFKSFLRSFSYLYPKKYQLYLQIAEMINSKYSKFELDVDFSKKKSSNSERYDFYDGPRINYALSSLIIKDDVDSLQKLSSNPKIHISEERVFIKLDNSFRCKKIEPECNAIECAAFYGSLKCFKFLLLNIKLNSENLAKYAIAGGNPEIIHICEQQKCNFKDTLDIAIAFHHNDIVQWIVYNDIDGIKWNILDICANAINFDMFQFFLNGTTGTVSNEEKFVAKYILYVFQYYNVQLESNDFIDFILKYKSMKFTDKFGLIYCSNEKAKLFYIIFSNMSGNYVYENPLNIAAYNGDCEMCKLLISHSKNDENEDENSSRNELFIHLQRSIQFNLVKNEELGPIFYAVQSGSFETVKYLMKECIVEKQSDDKINPLHMVAMLNLIEMGKLLVESYDINSFDYQNHTPLMYAIKYHSLEFIQFLLQQPTIDINIQDKGGLTPLHYAIIENDILTFKQLFNMEKINAFLIDSHKSTIWHFAVKFKRIEIFKEIFSKTKEKINEADINGKTALMYAIIHESEDFFNLLIEYEGIDLNIKDNEGQSALSIAMNRFLYRENNDSVTIEVMICKLLSKNSIDVNIGDSFGDTPIMIAAKKKSLKFYKMISDKGDVDYNHVNMNGQNLMHFAAEMKDAELQKIIIENDKIDININDELERSPLSLAIQYRNKSFIEAIIEDSRTDINIKDIWGCTPLMTAIELGNEDAEHLLIEHPKIDIKLKDNKNNNYLHIACHNKETDIISSLISKGVDINAKNYEGNTPLHIAIMRKNTKAVTYILKSSSNIAINELNELGKAPIHIACEIDSYKKGGKIIKLLLSYSGIDVNIRDLDGRSPLMIAQENNNSIIVDYLMKDGRTNLK